MVSPTVKLQSYIPDEVHPHIPVSLVYDNIDPLEETLSGAGTTHRVNRIVIQKLFIPANAIITKSRRRSINVSMLLPNNYRSTTVAPDLSHMLQQRYRIKDTYEWEDSLKKNLIWNFDL